MAYIDMELTSYPEAFQSISTEAHSLLLAFCETLPLRHFFLPSIQIAKEVFLQPLKTRRYYVYAAWNRWLIFAETKAKPKKNTTKYTNCNIKKLIIQKRKVINGSKQIAIVWRTFYFCSVNIFFFFLRVVD